MSDRANKVMTQIDKFRTHKAHAYRVAMAKALKDMHNIFGKMIPANLNEF